MNKNRLCPLISLILVFIFSAEYTVAVPVKGELRKWTRIDGKTVQARLTDIGAKDITLLIKGKHYTYEIKQFSVEDLAYLETMKPVPLVGKINLFPIEEVSLNQHEFLKKYDIMSYSWDYQEKGKPQQQLRFLFYEPNRKKVRAKTPLIVHLCGTGGVGKNNIKPLFNDAGGTAKNFFDKSLQGISPCHIMIPQAGSIGCWFSASYTDPSEHMEWLVYAVRHMVTKEDSNIDPDRIYVTGLSMGGAGVFQAIAKFPEVFAAGIPISYVEAVDLFHAKNSRPLWIVVNSGDLDGTEELLKEFKSKYKKWNRQLRVTVNQAAGHNAWSSLMKDQKFRTWLFSKKLP